MNMNGKVLGMLGAAFGVALLLTSKKSGAVEEPPAGEDFTPPKPRSPTAPKPPVVVTGQSGTEYVVQKSTSQSWIVKSKEFPAVFAIVDAQRNILSVSKISNPTSASELEMLRSDLPELPDEAFR